jgi:excisionase family DNA binding protein
MEGVEMPVPQSSTAEDRPVDVKTAARFLGVTSSLLYAYVERKQIPHYRMMGRSIRFRLSNYGHHEPMRSRM